MFLCNANRINISLTSRNGLKFCIFH